jgi:hypothetical protein
MRLRNSVSSASGTFTLNGRISVLPLVGVTLAPVALFKFAVLATVALVVFVIVPDAVVADTPLIFLRTFGIPNAPNPTNKEPAPISFTKALLEIFFFPKSSWSEDMIQKCLVQSIKVFGTKNMHKGVRITIFVKFLYNLNTKIENLAASVTTINLNVVLMAFFSLSFQKICWTVKCKMDLAYPISEYDQLVFGQCTKMRLLHHLKFFLKLS